MKILLIVYDNESHIHWFPSNIAYIAAVIQKEGYHVDIYHQNVHHYSEEHLTSFLDKNPYDLVGLGVIGGYYQYRKLLKISEAINRSKNRPFYVLGGHGPSPDPSFFLKKTGADAIVMGEGEISIINLIKTLESNKPLDKVKGIAYKKDQEVVVNESQALISDLDTIPFPAYKLFPIEYYRLIRFAHAKNSDFVMPMLSGRGCKFNCNFCYRMDKGHRARSNESIIEEIKMLRKDYNINYIYFFDELLMSSGQRAMNLAEAFIKADIGIKWSCLGRLNYAKPDVLALMKKAGCVYIGYGIESMDNTVLRNMNKALTVNQIIKGIEATLAAKISPGFNIIFGNIGDNKYTLKKSVDFLLKYDDGSELRTIRPVTPYPGCDLFNYAIKHGLLIDIEDFYENKHINSDLLSVNFTDMTVEEFHQALFDANSLLLNNYYNRKKTNIISSLQSLYFSDDNSFRGFRHT